MSEVGKILHTLSFIEQSELDRNPIKFRDNFLKMNTKWGLYSTIEVIGLSDYDLNYVLEILKHLTVSDAEKDIFGDFIETIRSKWSKEAGGQFFTDSQITKLAISMIDYRPLDGDKLVDICAGTGGFLLAAINKIKLDVSNHIEDASDEFIADISHKSIYGNEIDDEVSKIGNATIESRIGLGREIIKLGDSISKEVLSANGIAEEMFDCIATNPPFGSKIKVRDPAKLMPFQLSRMSNSTKYDSYSVHPRSLDILFIEQNVKLLKKGVGRIAIVLPYQILSGPQTRYVRDWILKNLIVEAVIDLPSDTFQPHTGTKTSLLVARRRKNVLVSLDEVEDYEIFMSNPKNIGHDRRGVKIFDDATGLLKSDIPTLEEEFNSYRKSGVLSGKPENVKLIPAKRIKNDQEIRLNAAFYCEEVTEKIVKSDHFDYIPLSNLVDSIFYPGRFKREYVEKSSEAVPFLGGASVMQYIVREEKWISKNSRYIDELSVKPGWLLVTRSGSTGLISSVPLSWSGYAISEHVIRIIPDENKLPAGFLLAFLRSEYAQREIKKGVFGSVIDEISPENLGKILVPVPKNQDVLQSISKAVEDAENSRQSSIEMTKMAHALLEEMLNQL